MLLYVKGCGAAMSEESILATVVDRIVRKFDPLKVILFGSRATGRAAADSDVDILVVLPTIVDKHRTCVTIRRALSDLPVGKDIVVTTPSEIAGRGNVVGTVLSAALQTGKVLFERS